jgi:GT2 family glycosyltransferase
MARVDDASTHAPTIAALRELAAADSRIRLTLNTSNLGISGASNVALAAAAGNYVALVDHDDLLSRDAFLAIYHDWRNNPATQLYYTDECKLNDQNELEQFWPKPDWSPVYLENTMSLGHLAVYATQFLRELGGFRPQFDGTQDLRGKPIDLVINCITSFEQRAFYPNREYIVVHGGNLTEKQVRQLEAVPGVVLVENVQPAFNFFQTINLGVARARGQYVCLLNDDVEAITDGGGEELVGYLARNSNVGAIGPLCLYENGNIQQNGVVLLTAVGPAHSGYNRPRTFGAQNQILHCRREAFCIGAAVMFVKKSVYEDVGGFSEDLPLNYSDVEFCQTVRERGYSCIVDPAIEVYHYESTTQRGMSMVEQEVLFLKHPNMSDPYFSKWFDSGDPNFRLDLRPPEKRTLNFGSWFDRYMARRAAASTPATNQHRFSVCVCVQDQPRRRLDDMYKSVLMQSYRNRELVILDNGSSNPETLEWLWGAERVGAAKILRAGTTLSPTRRDGPFCRAQPATLSSR